MKYKLSYYTISTPDVTENQCILYATRTGTPVIISTDLLEEIKNGLFENIPVRLMELLIQSEAIVPSEENELAELVFKAKISMQEDKSYLNFTVQTTANCQLGCFYCGQQHTKHNMKTDVIENTIKRFEYKISRKDYKEVDISWFGGEPLMSWNTMKYMSKKLKKITEDHHCRYSSHLVTNGLSLKEHIYEELATDMNCSFIDITLDGVAEYHDKRRMTKSNNNSFDIIFGNILAILNRPDYPINGCKISIRCNIDDTNVDSVSPLIQLLVQHNLQDKVDFYLAPVYSWGNDAHLKTNKTDIADREIDWFIEMYKAGFKMTVLPRPKELVCSAVNPDYELVDPWGKVYNCTETPLVPVYGPEHVIGNVNKSITETASFEDRPFTNWYDKILDASNGYYCTTCKILPLCGGRCPKSWTDGAPACPSMKFNMEDRLVLSYLYAKSNLQELA
ncbi:radical SAM protein [Chryseobacterium arthrosphaerae]|uniref:radical SAM/SPASM domain-containing protein n=1 Tax=Chryseobacterium arthrosphaerae TaxID=651561 RepID=UPI0023E1A8EA|nr:radical SAM protein [Chryseobacterium arthrosphaerae]WES97623.1 radical SAM protein [Chryseobacterium arthrosphaerae]